MSSTAEKTIDLEAATVEIVPAWRPYSGATWRSHVLSDLEVDRPWYARMRDAWLARVAENGIVDVTATSSRRTPTGSTSSIEAPERDETRHG